MAVNEVQNDEELDPEIEDDGDWDEEEEEAGDVQDDASAVAEEVAPQIDPKLLDVARQFGLTDEEISVFPDDKTLHSVLSAMDRTTMSVLRNIQTTATGGGQEEQTKTEAQVQKLIEKYNLDLDPNEWDADTIEKLGGLSDYTYAQLEKLEAEIKKRDEQISAIFQHVQLQEAQRAEETIDEWFLELPEDYADLFGKGNLEKLPQTGPQAEERRKLVKEAVAIANVDSQMGRRPGTFKTNLQRALLARFPEKTEKVVRNKVQKEQKARRGQSLSRPGPKPKNAKSGKQAAVDFIRSKYKQLGLSADEQDDDNDVFG